MKRAVAIISLITALAGCDGGGAGSDGTPEGMDNAAMKARQAEASAGEGRQVLAEDLYIRERSPTLIFEWHAPPEVARYPALLDRIRAEAEAEFDEISENAREFAQMLVEQGMEPRPLSYSQSWTVAYDAAGLFNLVSSVDRYDGGAHGNQFYDSIFWDKALNREIELPALFVNWPEAREMLGPRVCKRLDEMRSQKRGEEVVSDGSDDFNDCPDLTEVPVALRATNGGNLMSVEVLLAPYVAGAYAEGDYVVRIDAAEDVKAAIKSGYLPGG